MSFNNAQCECECEKEIKTVRFSVHKKDTLKREGIPNEIFKMKCRGGEFFTATTCLNGRAEFFLPFPGKYILSEEVPAIGFTPDLSRYLIKISLEGCISVRRIRNKSFRSEEGTTFRFNKSSNELVLHTMPLCEPANDLGILPRSRLFIPVLTDIEVAKAAKSSEECVTACNFNEFSGNILSVGEGRDFETVNEAIANAVSGDKILVFPGTYNENVLIDRDVFIIAAEPCEHNSRVTSFHASSNTVTRIEGFEVFGSGNIIAESAISIGANVRVDIINNVITNPDFDLNNDDTFYDGIIIQYNTDENGSRAVISGNVFLNIWAGIWINDYFLLNAELVIDRNVFDGIGRVFVAGPCGFARFTNNTVRNLTEYTFDDVVYAGLCIQVRDDSAPNAPLPSTIVCKFNNFETDTFSPFTFIVARSPDHSLVNGGSGLDLTCNLFNGKKISAEFYNIFADAASSAAVFPRRRRIIFENQRSDTQDAILSKFILSGVPIGCLPVPCRQGFTFAGWFSDPRSNTRFTCDSIFCTTTDTATENIPMFARWIKNTPSRTCGIFRSPIK